MLRTIYFLLFLIPLSLFAQGHDIGNGGNGVVCYNNLSRTKIVSVDLFDYWEHGQVVHVPGGIQLGGNTLSVHEKINIATSRLEYFDKKLANDVRTIALSMADNIERYLVTAEELPEINDANPRVLPMSPCFIEQFAVQWQDLKTGARRFAISKTFYEFSGTTNYTRAGLLLHEALYRVAILRGAQNSDGVRYFNYLMATKLFESEDLSTYVYHLRKADLDDKRCRLMVSPILGVPVYVMGAADMFACSPIRLSFKKWRVESNHMTWPEADMLKLDLEKIFVKEGNSWAEIKALGAELGYMTVYEQNKIGWIKLFESETHSLAISTSQNKIPCDVSRRINTFQLNKDEEIISCMVRDEYSYKSKQGMSFTLKALSFIKLTEDKNLLEFTLSSPSDMYFSGTKTLLNVDTSAPVIVDSEEKLISGRLSQPFVTKINGIETSISRIDGVGPKGGAMINVTHPRDALFLGRRVLRSFEHTGLNKAQPLCRKLGYQGSNSEGSFVKIYVTQTESFYNQNADKMEEKADEFVEILPPNIQCSGVFEAMI